VSAAIGDDLRAHRVEPREEFRLLTEALDSACLRTRRTDYNLGWSGTFVAAPAPVTEAAPATA
jgi:hypothetical protein